MKETDWFSWDKKPVRTGVYKTKLPSGREGFSRWHNGFWCRTQPTPGYAVVERSRSMVQNKQWKGLLKETK